MRGYLLNGEYHTSCRRQPTIYFTDKFNLIIHHFRGRMDELAGRGEQKPGEFERNPEI
jgi:hypothetical protein